VQRELRLVGSEEPFEQADVGARPRRREPDRLSVKMTLQTPVDVVVSAHAKGPCCSEEEEYT